MGGVWVRLGSNRAVRHAADAVHQAGGIEVDEEPELAAGQLEVGQQLRFMQRVQSLDRLEFHDHVTLDNQIQPVSDVEVQVTVRDRLRYLTFQRQAAPVNSCTRQASYADSSKPGPSARCTSMAAPMICSVMSFNRMVNSRARPHWA